MSTRPQEAPGTWTGKLKAFFARYGRTGLVVYFAVSTLSLSSIYSAVYFGVDVHSLLKRVGWEDNKWLNSAGTFAVAYAIHKALLPVRLVVTAGLTRFLVRRNIFGLKSK